MRKMLLSLLAAGTVLATAAPALARDGCGRDFHRGGNGRCYPNRGPAPVVVGAPGVRLVIGNYYPNRGYWDGRRYYQRREHWRGGWRYR
ncbi:hypothetical protein [Sphingomonas bacterium]|uniref:GCG_CRPN prefix-to-repeats domain-containing protein n=1 Tax=Sphingomonas bacterium TaxID=1895847 RepID=UPI0026069027|nr:hypothetical protein [Sphingomonas bacterium]MDB5679768.1 hypothetical protein [Sphingomonas bacterium]